MLIWYSEMDMKDHNPEMWKPPPAPKKPKMKDIFVMPKKISDKNIKMVSDSDLSKLTLVQLKKIAKQNGVKNYSSYRKAGLVDRLNKDSKLAFSVPHKGGARVGKKRGARLAFDTKKKK